MKQKGFFSAQPSVRPDQKGMASIVIVSVLIVILTLVSIGFARLMNRAITNSTDKELGVAANYAAQSGINSGIGYLQKNYVSTDPGALLNTGCSDLIGSTGALYSQANLSGEAGGGNVKYTCLTIDPEPTDLVFGGQDPLPPYKSEVIKLTTASGPALGGGSLMFAWSGTSGHNSTIAGTSLYDETTWSNKTLAPVLRVTLYPLANSTTPIDNAAVQAASRTYFFYPNTGNTSHPNNTAITPVNYATATEPLQGVQCGNEGKNGFDTGNDNPADYTCSVIISGLPADGLFYARMTPLYDSTNLRIQGNDNSGKLVKFVGVQAIVDSTAKANTSSKRLRARVDLGNNISPSDDAIPEFAADSANTICKRLDISDVTAKIADPYCLSQLNIQQPVPAVTLSASPTTIFVGQPTQLTWTSANVTACTSTWTGGAVALSDNQTEFPQVTTTYTINCTGPFGSANQSVTVAVNPILSFYTDNGSNSITIPYNTSTTLHWTITGQADWCYGTGGTGSWVGYKNHASGDNSTATGLLTSPQTYHLYCGNSTNNYQTPTQNVAITVSPPPPAPPVINQWFWNQNNNSPDSFTYNVSNSDKCIIYPDNGAATTQIAPVLNTNFSVSDGQSYTSATLKCWDHNVGPAVSDAIVPASATQVNVMFSQPTTGYNQEYTRTYKTSSPSEPNDCRDNLHNWAICFSLSANQNGNPALITSCDLTTNNGYRNTITNGPGQPHWSQKSDSSKPNWINYQLGWNVTINSSLNTWPANYNYYGDPGYNPSTTNSMPYDGTTLTAVCHGANASGQATYGPAEWHTCADRGQVGIYYSDVSQNGCSSVVLHGPPGGGGGGGGGTPPPSKQTCSWDGVTVNVPPGCVTCAIGGTASTPGNCPKKGGPS